MYICTSAFNKVVLPCQYVIQWWVMKESFMFPKSLYQSIVRRY